MPNKGFNADERSKSREEGPVVIGGKTYHARRLTNGRLKEVRRFSRDSQKEAREAARTCPEYQEAYDAAIEDGVRDPQDPETFLEGDALEKAARRIALEAGNGSDAVNEINTASLVKQLPLLLVDDDMKPISEEAVVHHLEEDLDQRDVGDLMTYLVGTPDEDPTPAS